MDGLGLQPLLGHEVHASPARNPHGAEVLEDPDVEVHGPVADMAAAQVGDEGLAEVVEQGPGEEDRDAGGARQAIHLDWVGRQVDPAGRDVQDAGLLVVVDGHAVHAQEVGDDVDVADQGDVAQRGRPGCQEGGDHRLGNEILRPPYGDLAAKRSAANDPEPARHSSSSCVVEAGPPALCARRTRHYRIALQRPACSAPVVGNVTTVVAVPRVRGGRHARGAWRSIGRAETTVSAGRCLFGRVVGLNAGREDS